MTGPNSRASWAQGRTEGSLAEIESSRQRLAAWHRSDAAIAGLPLGEVNWTYDGDVHVPAEARHDVFVMGLNAGDGLRAPHGRLSRSERAWRTRCRRLTEGIGDRTLLTELVMLATTTKALLKGSLTDLDAALRQSAEVNRAIIRYHQPKVIFQTGLGGDILQPIEPLYGLTHMCDGRRPDFPERTLFRHYEMPDGTPWIAFLHFAAHGFSDKDRDAIRGYAMQVLAARQTAGRA